MKSGYYRAVAAKAKASNWTTKKFAEFIKHNKSKPYSVALKNLEKES